MTIKATATRGFVDGETRVRRNAPLTLEQKEFDRLKALGLVNHAKSGDKPALSGDGLDERTVVDLRELAAAGGVDLGEATRKADVIAAIRAHRANG